MIHLGLAALAFLLLHRAVSGSPFRARLVALAGERRFTAGFALASLAGVLWLGVAYATTSPAWRDPLWIVPAWVPLAQFALQPASIVLIVAGFLGPNPTAVGQAELAERPDAVRGALRITRHPFLWGVVFFSLGHMAAVPSPRSLLLFGTLIVVALAGTFSIDGKRRRQLGEGWTAYADATSNLPFAAILAGRQPFRPAEFRIRDCAIAALLAVATALAHPAFWPGWLWN